MGAERISSAARVYARTANGLVSASSRSAAKSESRSAISAFVRSRRHDIDSSLVCSEKRRPAVCRPRLGVSERHAPRDLVRKHRFGLVNAPVKMYSAIDEHDLELHLVHEKDGSRDRLPEGLQEGGQGGSRRRDRQGVRGPRRRARLPHRGGLQGGRGGELPHDRGPRLRAARRDRPDRLPAHLLPRAGRGRGEGLRAPRQGDGELRAVGRRPLRLPRPAAARHAAHPRRRHHAREHVLRGRDPPDGRHRPVGSRPRGQARARDGRDAHRAFTTSFDHAKYEDEYRDRLLDVVKQKRKGEEVHAAPQEERDAPADLLEALRASVDAAKGTSRANGRGKPARKRRTAKRRTAKSKR